MEVRDAIERLVSVRTEVATTVPLYPYNSFANVQPIEMLLSKQRVDLKGFIAGKRVMDAGCGDGDMAFICEMLGAGAVMAVDLPDTNYNQMRGVYAIKNALESSVHVFAGDIEDMDLSRTGLHDLILLLGTLYHLPNPHRVLRRLSVVTRELIVTTKVFDILPRKLSENSLRDAQLAYLLAPTESNNDPTNWWVFTETGLRLLLERAGWCIVQCMRFDEVIGHAEPACLEADGRVILLAHSVYL